MFCSEIHKYSHWYMFCARKALVFFFHKLSILWCTKPVHFTIPTNESVSSSNHKNHDIIMRSCNKLKCSLFCALVAGLNFMLFFPIIKDFNNFIMICYILFSENLENLTKASWLTSSDIPHHLVMVKYMSALLDFMLVL